MVGGMSWTPITGAGALRDTPTRRLPQQCPGHIGDGSSCPVAGGSSATTRNAHTTTNSALSAIRNTNADQVP